MRVDGKRLNQHFSVLLFFNNGDKVFKNWKLLDKSVPYLWQESQPCPLDWRTTIHCYIGLAFFHRPWYICLKIERQKQNFNVWLFPNQGDKFLVLIEILWSQDHSVERKWWNVQRNLNIEKCLSFVWLKHFQRFNTQHSFTYIHYCYK